jgi:uncharacterized RDD family membrane protein YckC
MEDLKYSTGLKRIGAAIVDSIVFWPLSLIIQSIYGLQMPEGLALTWNYILVVLPLAYSIFCHYKYGMTIGKWVAKIKVIDVSETKNISLKQAFLRDIFLVIMLVCDLAVGTLQNIYWTAGEFPEFISWISYFTGSAALIWTLAEIISLLTNRKRRAIHDFIAGTVVVRSDVFERSKLINESFRNAGEQ